MQAVVTSYVVVSHLPVVVEEGTEALSYAPGSVFQALSNNPSVIHLLETDQIIEVTSVYPTPGSIVIQGPTGPAGDPALVGWERIDVGSLVRLIEPGDQVSVGLPAPFVNAKFTIDALAGSFPTALKVISGDITCPDSGVNSERFGLDSSATGASSLALGNNSAATGAFSSAGGEDSVASGAASSAWGAKAAAGDDSTALGTYADADQGSTAVGRSATATGLRSFSGGLGATNVGTDSVLIGASGISSADETVVVGSSGSALADGAQAFGFDATALGVDSSAWGRGSTAYFDNSLAFGAGSETTAISQFVVGSHDNPIEFYYLGRGEADITAQNVRIASTRIATTQTNERGSDLILEAGPGTGNAIASKIFLQTAPAGPSGNSQQVLATQLTVGEGVDVTNWLNVGVTTAAAAVGDVAASNGVHLMSWTPASSHLNLGSAGSTTYIRAIDSASGGVAGCHLQIIGGEGLGAGVGGTVSVTGGAAASTGGLVVITGGASSGVAGGDVIITGGAGNPAGEVVIKGGTTDVIGGVSANATFSGGDGNPTQISIVGDAIVKGGDGLSSNNHGGHVFIKAGLADGAGTNGRIQIETGGINRWQVSNVGHILANTDNALDIGAVASGRPRDLFVGRDVVIGGDLTVNGDTTTLNTVNATIEDRLILLAKGATLADESGIAFERGATGDDAVVLWNEASTRFELGEFDTAEGLTHPAGDLAVLHDLRISDLSLAGNTVTSDAGLTVSTTGANDLIFNAHGTALKFNLASEPSLIAEFGGIDSIVGALNYLLSTGKDELETRLQNNTGTTLALGTAVYISGVDEISKADATSDSLASFFVGVTEADILDGEFGQVITEGPIPVLFGAGETTTPGTRCYLSTTAGEFTTSIPSGVGNVQQPTGVIRDPLTYDGVTDFLMTVQLIRSGRSELTT